MTGVVHELDLKLAVKAFDRLAGADMVAVADAIGNMIEGQTKERIATEKTAPDGAPWAPWSARYRKTRSNSNSLLVGEGNPGLLESIQNFSQGYNETAIVGTNLIYGATHQFGRGGIPARPYLGVSKANGDEIEQLVVDAMEGYLQ
jgi:phage virion morphogenesis protein